MTLKFAYGATICKYIGLFAIELLTWQWRCITHIWFRQKQMEKCVDTMLIIKKTKSNKKKHGILMDDNLGKQRKIVVNRILTASVKIRIWFCQFLITRWNDQTFVFLRGLTSCSGGEHVSAKVFRLTKILSFNLVRLKI